MIGGSIGVAMGHPFLLCKMLLIFMLFILETKIAKKWSVAHSVSSAPCLKDSGSTTDVVGNSSPPVFWFHPGKNWLDPDRKRLVRSSHPRSLHGTFRWGR